MTILSKQHISEDGNPNPKENVGLRNQKQDNTDTYLTP